MNTESNQIKLVPVLTLTSLYDLDDVITLHLLQIGHHHVHRECGVAAAHDPISDQR